MINKEEYKRELIRMWDSVRGDNLKGGKDCNGIKCEDCQFNSIPLCNKGISAFEMIEAVEKWSKEHPEPKYKVSKMEYDILDMFINDNSEIDYVFNNLGDKYMSKLLEKGYFDGATGETDVKEYFENCEILKIVKVDCKLGGNENVKRRKV